MATDVLVRAPGAQPATEAAGPRRVSPWTVSAAFWLVVLAIVAVRRSGAAELPEVATFGLIFASIAIEALPFILLGAIVSASVAVFLPDRAFARVGRMPRWMQVPGAALSGLAFPVCECGSVPVARRLIVRGIHPAAGIAFMLAAPALNPIVLSSTWVAYGGGTRGAEMVAGRAVLGLTIAVAGGLALARRGGDLLRGTAAGPDACEHDHEHDHGASRGRSFSEHLTSDFLFMGRFLVFGAALSALLQTIVPQGVASNLAAAPILGALTMMGLAFMLSLCSEADAFVASSFIGFPLSAQLAFLALGPVADTKLAVLYSATFRGRFVLRLLAVAVPICLIGTLLFGLVTG